MNRAPVRSTLVGIGICLASSVSTNSMAQNLLFVSDVVQCNSATTTNATNVRKIADNFASTTVLMTEANNCTSGNPYTSHFNPIWSSHRSRIEAVPGNHDYMMGLGYFDTYFGSNYGHYGVVAAPNANWAIVRIDTNYPTSPYGGMSASAWEAQKTWLDDTLTSLAEAGKRCVLAYGHHPRFSSGAHQSDAGLATYTQELWEILYHHGVELFLSGHDHHYERIVPTDKDGNVNFETGVAQFVVGTGGAALRPPTGSVHPNSVARIAENGLLALELGDTYWTASFETTDGSTKDWIVGMCH